MKVMVMKFMVSNVINCHLYFSLLLLACQILKVSRKYIIYETMVAICFILLKQAPTHLSPSLSVSSKTYDPPQMGAPKTLALPLNLPTLPPNN